MPLQTFCITLPGTVMTITRLSLLLFSFTLLFGCRYVVDTDFPEYLRTHAKQTALPQIDFHGSYVIDERTLSHFYVTPVPGLNTVFYQIRFGRMLDQSLQASYTQNAFGSLERADQVTDSGNVIFFSLRSYTFEKDAVFVTVEVTVRKDGETILDKAYSVPNGSPGKTSSIAFDNVAADSAKSSNKKAIDQILTALILDLGGIMPTAQNK